MNDTQELFAATLNEIDQNIGNKNSSNIIKTGFKKLDKIILGLFNGDLNIITARPGVGKTTFALTMFANITAQDINALYISFEKKETDLLKSILAIKTNINSFEFDSGLNKKSYKKLLDVLGQIYENSSMYLKSFYDADLITLKNYIQEKIEKDKIKIVFIDYLSMIIPREQVSQTSRALKSMAMEFNIPFVVLCPIYKNYDADRVILL